MRLAERGEEVMINETTLNNLRFANNIDLKADTEVNLQELTDRVDGSSRRMGLRINTGKTKTMTIGKQHKDIQIKLGGEVLEQVTKFVCLGRALTEDGRCTEDIRRIGLACAAFGKLDKMWRTKSSDDLGGKEMIRRSRSSSVTSARSVKR